MSVPVNEPKQDLYRRYGLAVPRMRYSQMQRRLNRASAANQEKRHSFPFHPKIG